MALKYPINVYDFSEMIDDGYLYVDKTGLVFNLVTNYKKVFFGRPRRFGKSLLTSTLDYYFQGRSDLFKNLEIYKLEKDWKKYPVLHFDLSTGLITDAAKIESDLNIKLLKYEKVYGKGEGEIDPGQRLGGIIERAAEKAGMKPVVLIDEYDKPVLDVLGDKDKLKEVRTVMQNFYAPLKAAKLRFLFITGITKFSQMSIFSQLNDLEVISMLSEYASLCGITEEEMLRDLDEGIQDMADDKGWTKEECFKKLKENYDGYHFSHKSPDVYNPFSLLQALKKHELGSYWYASTPSFLIEQMKKFNVSPQLLGRQQSYASAFDVSIEDMQSITPLLFQSGYLTIKGYIEDPETYFLDIPNKEVRIGLMECMVSFLGIDSVIPARKLADDMYVAFKTEDFDKVMQLLQTYLATVPYTTIKDSEGHYQSLLYVLFSLLSKNVQVETRTSRGRVDVVVESPKYIYLIEIKLNKSAEDALEQIDLKQYADKFSLETKPIRKVGVNFSKKTRNITDWKIVE